MDVKVIKTQIMMNNYSNEELNEFVEAIRYARAQLTRNVKRGLRIGDNVNFVSGRTGRNYTGSVVKVAIKFVTVRTKEGLFKVPASMLTRVADETELAA